MRVVWDRKSVSASQVQMEQVRQGRETAYTTVKTMLDRLTRAGVCKAKEIKGRYYYTPILSADEVARAWYEHLREKIWGYYEDTRR
jgi:predicted transcriptional regulator